MTTITQYADRIATFADETLTTLKQDLSVAAEATNSTILHATSIGWLEVRIASMRAELAGYVAQIAAIDAEKARRAA